MLIDKYDLTLRDMLNVLCPFREELFNCMWSSTDGFLCTDAVLNNVQSTGRMLEVALMDDMHENQSEKRPDDDSGA